MTLPLPPRRQYAAIGDVEMAMIALEEIPITGPGVTVQVIDVLTTMGDWVKTRRAQASVDDLPRLDALTKRMVELAYRLGGEHAGWTTP